MPNPRTITDIRRELVTQSNKLHQRSNAYLELMKSPNSTPADFDAFEGLATAGTYAFALAAVLRTYVKDQPQAEEILTMIVGEVMNSGTDWLEFANNDLTDATGATP